MCNTFRWTHCDAVVAERFQAADDDIEETCAIPDCTNADSPNGWQGILLPEKALRRLDLTLGSKLHWRMLGLLAVLVDWLKTHESLAIWLEGVALVAIFFLDWKERQDQRKERQEQHKETAQQLDVAQRQVEAAIRSAEAARLSAEATAQAAEASQKSAHVLAELNRPYMGVAGVELRPDRNSQNNPVWSIAWTIRNFGSLPARDVQAAVELHLEGKGLLLDDKDNGPHGAEFFPQSEGVTTITILKWDDQQDRLSVMNGQNTFVVRVSISYASSGGFQYKHSADAKFNRGYGTFSVNASQTQAA